MSKLIFIDTNIFLDFYRIRKGSIGLKFLKKIEENLDKIIITRQVQMEYLKNRQSVIHEYLKEMKSDIKPLSIPSILQDSIAAKAYSTKSKGADKQLKTLKKRINKIFTNPSQNDPVFKVMNRIFKNNYNLHLDINHKETHEIIKRAHKRFQMGYPPRKKGDNSIGDAINWEWMMHCCKSCSSDLIIVTRDTDFGKENDNDLHINDWLKKEFKERNTTRRNISITRSLTFAFKEINKPVSATMKKEENQLLNTLNKRDESQNELRILRSDIYKNFYR